MDGMTGMNYKCLTGINFKCECGEHEFAIKLPQSREEHAWLVTCLTCEQSYDLLPGGDITLIRMAVCKE